MLKQNKNSSMGEISVDKVEVCLNILDKCLHHDNYLYMNIFEYLIGDALLTTQEIALHGAKILEMILVDAKELTTLHLDAFLYFLQSATK